jgi:hypothetical protein
MIGAANKYICGEVLKRMPRSSEQQQQNQQDESVVKTIQVLFSHALLVSITYLLHCNCCIGTPSDPLMKNVLYDKTMC